MLCGADLLPPDALLLLGLNPTVTIATKVGSYGRDAGNTVSRQHPGQMIEPCTLVLM